MAEAWTPFNWYRDVEYYDVVFDQTTREEVTFLEGIAARHGTDGRRVLEPGCGSGRLVAAMARRGWSVTGFDLEPTALEFARARLARSRSARAPSRRHGAVRLMVGRFDRFRVADESIDLAHCLYSTLLHATAPGEAERHLRLMADALSPGGLYVVGIHLTDYRRREPIRERADCRRGRLRVIYTLRHGVPDRARRLQPMRCRLAVRRDAAVRRSRPHPVRRLESTWSFRTYDERELGVLLASEPRLELVTTHDFHHDLDSRNEGRDATFDRVLILRKRRSRRSRVRVAAG